MEISTAIVLAVVLLIGLWISSYIVYIRRGKAHGHTWFTWWKPRGHPDIGPDIGGFRQTRPAQTMLAGLVTDSTPPRTNRAAGTPGSGAMPRGMVRPASLSGQVRRTAPALRRVDARRRG